MLYGASACCVTGRSLAGSTGSSIEEVGGTIAATRAAVRHAAAKQAAKHARIHSSYLAEAKVVR
jgi:hypothetical protein